MPRTGKQTRLFHSAKEIIQTTFTSNFQLTPFWKVVPEVPEGTGSRWLFGTEPENTIRHNGVFCAAGIFCPKFFLPLPFIMMHVKIISLVQILTTLPSHSLYKGGQLCLPRCDDDLKTQTLPVLGLTTNGVLFRFTLHTTTLCARLKLQYQFLGLIPRILVAGNWKRKPKWPLPKFFHRYWETSHVPQF